MKHLALIGGAMAVLLLLNGTLVSRDLPPAAADASAPEHADSHIGHYQAYLARLAITSVHCR